VPRAGIEDYPGTTDRQAAQIVMVPSGQTVGGLQFSMASAPAFHISGVIVDGAAAPVRGAVISLVSAREPSFTRVVTHAQRDGTFRIRGVISGAYRIMVATGDTASDDTIATELPLVVVVAIWSAVLFVPLSIGLESLRNSPEWRAWSERLERAHAMGDDHVSTRAGHEAEVRPFVVRLSNHRRADP
jgi:hypothetical protein